MNCRPTRSVHLLRPGEKLLELLLVARSLGRGGVRHHPGRALPGLHAPGQGLPTRVRVVSQRIVGGFLAGLFDGVITVDPHPYPRLEVSPRRFRCRMRSLSGAGLLADVAVAPRPPAAEWGRMPSRRGVETAARRHGSDAIVETQLRHGDRESISRRPRARRWPGVRWCCSTTSPAPGTPSRVRPSACGTAAGATSVDVAVTPRAVPAGDALEVIRAAGVGEVWSTDCIAHLEHRCSRAPMLAEAPGAVLADQRPAAAPGPARACGRIVVRGDDDHGP